MRRASAIVALVALAAPARADTPPTPPLEIVVVGARREDRGTAVTVVDAGQIERLGATTVSDALSRLPALHAGSDARGERIVSMRGFDQRQIAVFVDGVPVSVPYDGQIDLSKMPVDMVSRLVVIKGASSLLYGPGGLGGAINVITRDPGERLSVRGLAEASPFLAARGSLTIGGKIGPVSALVGAGFEEVLYQPLSGRFTPLANEDGGRRDNSDRLSGNLAAKVAWDASPEHRFTLSLSHFHGTFGVPPATRDFTVRYWRWSDWSASTLGLSHAFRSGRLQTEALAYLSFFGNTLDSFDDARYLTQDKRRAWHSVYDDSTAGGFVRSALTVPVGRERALILRTWTGLRHDAHSGQADRGADTLRAATSIVTVSAQGEIDVVPRWLKATAGAQLDGELPGAASIGPSPRPALGSGPQGALTFTPGRAFSFTASLAQRTRFPTLRERFSTVFGARAPNPDLRPERAINLSLDGVFRPSPSLRFAASFFEAELTDLIQSVIIAPGTDQMANVARARLLGGEAEVRWTLATWVDLLAGFTLLHARRLDGPEPRLAYRPDHKGLVMLTVSPLPGLSITGVMRHVGGQDFQNPDTGRWGHLGAYQLFDARLEYAFVPGARWTAPLPRDGRGDVLRAFIRAQNLADASVESRYSFPEPGRQVFVGLGTSVGL